MYYYLYQAIWRSNNSVYLILYPDATNFMKILFGHYSKMAAKEPIFAISLIFVMFSE